MIITTLDNITIEAEYKYNGEIYSTQDLAEAAARYDRAWNELSEMFNSEMADIIMGNKQAVFVILHKERAL